MLTIPGLGHPSIIAMWNRTLLFFAEAISRKPIGPSFSRRQASERRTLTPWESMTRARDARRFGSPVRADSRSWAHSIAAVLALANLAAPQGEIVGWGAQVFNSAWNHESFVEVEAGGYQTVARRGDGSVVAWGDNAYGQCNVPALPSGLSYVEVATGGIFLVSPGGMYPAGHTVARRSDGSVVAWGDDSYGQCNVPALPSGLSYVEVAAGQFHTVARRSDGSVVEWGAVSGSLPALPAGLTYVEVAAGYSHTVARRSDGSVVESGATVPALPAGLLYVEVAAGAYHTVARRSDGSVVEWGAVSGSVPALPAGLTYVEVSAGYFHTVARRSDGSVVAWGNNQNGQCDVLALPSGLSYVEIAAGWIHTVARRSDGSVVAWGDNSYSQCNVPALRSGLSYVEVAAGGVLGCDNYGVCHPIGNTVARRSDGSVVAWGSNDYGQCNVPALPSGLSYVEVAAGQFHTVARRSDGSVVAWGDNFFGQCDVPALPGGLSYVEVGAGWARTVARLSDGSVVEWGWITGSVPALPAGLTYVEVAAGSGHTVARRIDGSVVAWGGNYHGECDVPALPSGLSYIEVAAGLSHSVARRSDGSVVAWGDNFYGQCNVLALPSGFSYVELAAGGGNQSCTGFCYPLGHTVARRSDGSVVAWGDNSYGQCNVPALPPGSSFAEVEAVAAMTVARVEPAPACGSVSSYCWPGAANSASPAGASFEVQGCPGLTANDLIFEVSGLPPDKRGIFIYGPRQTHAPFGNGWLCIGGAVQRVLPPVASSLAGVVTYPVDLTRPPFGSGPNAILPGSNWNFQFWFRDPAGGGVEANVSDAKHIVFAP